MKKKVQGFDCEISMIVPSYMAQDFIYRNLIDLYKLLKTLNKPFEIICVVDGGFDNTFLEATKAEAKYEQIKIYTYKENRGKGYAVRFGMKKARGGSVIGFIDAGRDLDYKSILDFFKIMDTNKADIVIGSKRHSDSQVNYSRLRKLYSLGYQFYVKNLFGLSVVDTQVGMKIFKNKIIRKILPSLTVDGFAFDIEILSISQKILKAKIIEAPIHVDLDEKSSTIKMKGGFILSSIKVFWDTLVIFYKLYISGFYKRVILS